MPICICLFYILMTANDHIKWHKLNCLPVTLAPWKQRVRQHAHSSSESTADSTRYVTAFGSAFQSRESFEVPAFWELSIRCRSVIGAAEEKLFSRSIRRPLVDRVRPVSSLPLDFERKFWSIGPYAVCERDPVGCDLMFVCLFLFCFHLVIWGQSSFKIHHFQFTVLLFIVV